MISLRHHPRLKKVLSSLLVRDLLVWTFHSTIKIWIEMSTLSLSLAVIVDNPLFGFWTTSSIGYKKKENETKLLSERSLALWDPSCRFVATDIEWPHIRPRIWPGILQLQTMGAITRRSLFHVVVFLDNTFNSQRPSLHPGVLMVTEEQILRETWDIWEISMGQWKWKGERGC